VRQLPSACSSAVCRAAGQRLPQLPSPAAAVRATDTVNAYERSADGAEFDPVLPADGVSPAGTAIELVPGAAGALAGRAYCGYRFQQPLVWETTGLRLNWDTRPAAGAAWVGVADFARNSWRWYAAPSDDVLRLPESLAFREPQTGLLLVQLVVEGPKPARLARIELEGNAEGWLHDWVPEADVAFKPYAFSAGGGLLLSVGQPVNSSFEHSVVLVCHNDAGKFLWARRMDCAGYDVGAEVAVSAAGEITLGLSGGNWQANDYIAAVVRLDRDGAVRWQHSFNASSPEQWFIVDLDVTGAGQTLLVGELPGGDSFREGFAALLAADGTLQWAVSLPSKYLNWSDGYRTVSAENGLVVAGCYRPTPDAYHQGILIRFDEAGNQLWQTRWQGEYNQYTNRIVPDGAGGWWLGGMDGVRRADFGLNRGDATLLHFGPDGTLQQARRWGMLTLSGAPAVDEAIDLERRGDELLLLTHTRADTGWSGDGAICNGMQLLRYSDSGVLTGISRAMNVLDPFYLNLAVTGDGGLCLMSANPLFSAYWWPFTQADAAGGLQQIPSDLPLQSLTLLSQTLEVQVTPLVGISDELPAGQDQRLNLLRSEPDWP
jgi:hypothetical protein